MHVSYSYTKRFFSSINFFLAFSFFNKQQNYLSHSNPMILFYWNSWRFFFLKRINCLIVLTKQVLIWISLSIDYSIFYPLLSIQLWWSLTSYQSLNSFDEMKAQIINICQFVCAPSSLFGRNCPHTPTIFLTDGCSWLISTYLVFTFTFWYFWRKKK